MQGFLREIGNRWIPLVMNPFQAIERKDAGEGLRAALSEDFMIERFFLQRLADMGGEIPDEIASETFFDLSEVITWLQRLREGIDTTRRDLLHTLRAGLESIRKGPDAGASPSYDSAHAVKYVTWHLVRILATELKFHQLKKGDETDFLHATLGCAYAHVLALDKHWKRRVGMLPEAGSLARCFYKNELNSLVTCLEGLVSLRSQDASSAPGAAS